MNAAVVSAKQDFPKLTRNGINPHFESTYATLDDVLACVTPALHANGLDIFTGNHMIDGKPMCVTTLMHSGGGYRTSSFPIADLAPQKIGGTMTYAQRYNICSLLSLQIEDDDDGNRASGLKAKKSNSPRNGNPSSRPQSGGDSWI